MADLVIMHKQLGDTVLLEPVLRKLSGAAGEQVRLFCPLGLMPLLELMPHTVQMKGLKRFHASRVWSYDFGNRTTRAAFLTWAREKTLLLPHSDYLRFSHRLAYSQINIEPYHDRYMARYFWDHTPGKTGETFTPPRLLVPPSSWAPGAFAERDYILLNPVSAWKSKGYDPEKWIEIIQGFLAKETGPLVLTGGVEPWHVDVCRQIAARFPRKVLNLAARTSLKEFMFLISRSRLVLSVDGACAHLARAFDLPCITLFGPSYVNLWHLPDSKRIALKAVDYSKEQRPSATRIPAAAVLEAAQDLLEKNLRSPDD
jgi:ADP-heptose:LPS heptosyltransferase